MNDNEWRKDNPPKDGTIIDLCFGGLMTCRWWGEVSQRWMTHRAHKGINEPIRTGLLREREPDMWKPYGPVVGSIASVELLKEKET